MGIESLIALAGATALFALIPGPGIMAVVAQALSRGFGPAVSWAVGQTMGDMVYLLTAMLGLGWIASQLGEGFVVLRWAGAAYLVWMGIKAWTAKPPAAGRGAGPALGGGVRSWAACACPWAIPSASPSTAASCPRFSTWAR